MNYLGVHLTPDLLAESWRELERQRERERRIREARVARRAERPSRFVTLTARLSAVRKPKPCLQLAEGC
jgi:hypothetical protein